MLEIEGGKIGQRQLRWLICIVIVSTVVLYLPAYISKYAKQDSWLSIIIVTLVSSALTTIIIKLGLRFPNQTIISYSQLIVGKPLGKLISIGYLLFFIHISALIMRQIAVFLTAIFLPNTPLLLIIFLIVFVSSLAVRNGIEVISRVNELVYPLVLILIFFIFILLFPELEYTKFHPILANGSLPVLAGSYVAILFFAETVILTIILPMINLHKRIFLSVFKSILVVGCLTIMIISMIIGLYGGSDSAELTFPALSAVRYISVFNFLERIDAFIMAVWIGGGFIKLTIFYYCSVITTAQLFNLKTYRPVVFPIGIVICFLAPILFRNIAEMQELFLDVLPPYYLSFEFGIPSLLLIIAKIRGVRGDLSC